MHLKKIVCAFTIISIFYPMIVNAEDVVLSAKTQQNTNNETHHIRSLAASCAACHGTNGTPASGDAAGRIKTLDGQSVQLAGINPQVFIRQMQAFKSGERVATVMHHHAKGLNGEEITALATYFSAQIPHQAPHQAIPLTPQTLSKMHAN